MNSASSSAKRASASGNLWSWSFRKSIASGSRCALTSVAFHGVGHRRNLTMYSDVQHRIKHSDWHQPSGALCGNAFSRKCSARHSALSGVMVLFGDKMCRLAVRKPTPENLGYLHCDSSCRADFRGAAPSASDVCKMSIMSPFTTAVELQTCQKRQLNGDKQPFGRF